MKGKFITFEGSEGSGKSTQIKRLKQYLLKKKKKVLFIREPGGVPISEKIRKILLDVKNKSMHDSCETLLYMAARGQLVSETIIPALKEGKIVLCDRFLDSTLAYQGYGSGVDIKLIKKLGDYVCQGIKPDITFVFDLEAKKGLSRIKGKKDRIEKRAISYHNKVRNGFLRIARSEPRRVKIIKANKDRDAISEEIIKHIDRIV